jgi:CheY-like chemotaxis protein
MLACFSQPRMPARVQNLHPGKGRTCNDWHIATGSVFLVEDEALIRMMVVEMLEELGHSVAAEAGGIDEAMRLAQSADFDLAILDVNLGGKMSFSVADAIRSRGLPVIIASGYGSQGMPNPYRDWPILQKPFEIDILQQMIDHVETTPINTPPQFAAFISWWRLYAGSAETNALPTTLGRPLARVRSAGS